MLVAHLVEERVRGIRREDRLPSLRSPDRHLGHASLLHFAIKLFFAAPCSGLPSALTALGSQASFLHFFTKLFLAAPWSGLPVVLTALLLQDCAIAVPMGKNAIEAARAKAARAKPE